MERHDVAASTKPCVATGLRFESRLMRISLIRDGSRIAEHTRNSVHFGRFFPAPHCCVSK